MAELGWKRKRKASYHKERVERTGKLETWIRQIESKKKIENVRGHDMVLQTSKTGGGAVIYSQNRSEIAEFRL